MSCCYRIFSCDHTEPCHVTESYPVTIQSQVMLVPNPILLPYRVISRCYRILSCYHTESCHVTESYSVTIQNQVMLPNPLLLPYRVMSCCYRILSYYHTVMSCFYPNTMLLPYTVMSCRYRILSYYHTQSYHVVTDTYSIAVRIYLSGYHFKIWINKNSTYLCVS
jgi:hypothetical protein